MKITKEQLEKIVMREGRVLLKIDTLQKDTVTFGSTTLSVTALSTESKAALTARCGTVVVLPTKTNFPEMNYSFQSELELEVGDKVWWSKTCIGTLIKQLRNEVMFLECDDENYIILPYQEMIMRERNGVRVGLNDRVLAKLIFPTLNSTLDLSMTSLALHIRDEFEVVYVPSFKGYYNNGRDIIECEVGDRVKVLGGGRSVGELEDEYNLEAGEKLVYFRSADVVGIEKTINK